MNAGIVAELASSIVFVPEDPQRHLNVSSPVLAVTGQIRYSRGPIEPAVLSVRISSRVEKAIPIPWRRKAWSAHPQHRGEPQGSPSFRSARIAGMWNCFGRQ